jgi:ParB-like chromosome segregation protein Spo0J
MPDNQLTIVEVPAKDLIPADYNPRRWDDVSYANLKESIKRFGMVDPIIVNGCSNRKNVVIGGHFRLKVAQDVGFKTVPVVYLNIPDLAKEKELNLRLNKNTGEWDWNLLAKFNESVLSEIGFSSQELDDIFKKSLKNWI